MTQPVAQRLAELQAQAKSGTAPNAPATTSQPTPSNSKAVKKQLVKELVEILQLKDDLTEKANKIAKTGKETLGIKPSVSKAAAAILHKSSKPEYNERQKVLKDFLDEIAD